MACYFNVQSNFSVLNWTNIFTVRCLYQLFFYHEATAPSESSPLHYRSFMITLRHTELGRTPLDE